MKIIALPLIILFYGCYPKTYLRQGTSFTDNSSNSERLQCLLAPTAYVQTTDYTIYRCTTDSTVFYFMPSNLSVEKDLNSNPLVFFQYLSKNAINVIVKFTYDKNKFIEAASLLKVQDATFNLNILPIHSVNLSNATTIPGNNIYFFGNSTYSYFEGYITFEIHGRTQVSSMRSLLISDVGFQMIYQFDYLTVTNGNLLESNTVQIPVYIRNINL